MRNHLLSLSSHPSGPFDSPISSLPPLFLHSFYHLYSPPPPIPTHPSTLLSLLTYLLSSLLVLPLSLIFFLLPSPLFSHPTPSLPPPLSHLQTAIESTFPLQPVDTVAINGEDSQIDCLPPLSTPAATISWTRNFSLLTDPRFQVLQNGSLFISDVRLTDQGSYHCIATNLLLGVSRTSRGVTLTVLGKLVSFPNLCDVVWE